MSVKESGKIVSCVLMKFMNLEETIFLKTDMSSITDYFYIFNKIFLEQVDFNNMISHE
jgi:hypothetical protein